MLHRLHVAAYNLYRAYLRSRLDPARELAGDASPVPGSGGALRRVAVRHKTAVMLAVAVVGGVYAGGWIEDRQRHAELRGEWSEALDEQYGLVRAYGAAHAAELEESGLLREDHNVLEHLKIASDNPAQEPATLAAKKELDEGEARLNILSDQLDN